MLIYPEEVYKIQGGIFNVYKSLGPGLAERAYQKALEIEFDFLAIPYESQKELEVYHRNVRIDLAYKPDFVCYGKILLELKSVSELTTQHRLQLLNYLNISKCRLGLLVNFSHSPGAAVERIVRNEGTDNPQE